MALLLNNSPAPAGAPRRISGHWRIRQWLRSASYAPPWLPDRWRQPVVGYVGAVGITSAGVTLSYLLLNSLPGYAYGTPITLLAILGSALLWGAGPSLLATCLASLLTNFFIVSPRFALSFQSAGRVVGFAVLVLVGLGISLLTSQAEVRRRQLAVARAEAEAGRWRSEELERAREDFLFSAAHDLKNPLTSIQAQTQLAQRRLGRLESPIAAQALDLLAGVLQGTDTMADLINELLDVARLDMGGRIDLHCEPTDLVALLENCIADQRRASGRPIYLETEVPELYATIDVTRIRRVVGNLFSNALKYSPDGSGIWVRAAPETGTTGPEALIAVRDEGIGIPADDLPYIFDRFRRASNAGDYVPGTGIGLASVRGIVEQHGGTVTVVSTEGVGATFTVRLPLGGP